MHFMSAEGKSEKLLKAQKPHFCETLFYGFVYPLVSKTIEN